MPITRTWPTLCIPGQRRAGQALAAKRSSIRNADVSRIEEVLSSIKQDSN